MIHTFAAKTRNVTRPCGADVNLSENLKTGMIELADHGPLASILNSYILFHVCFSSVHLTKNTHFLSFTQNHIPLIMVSKLGKNTFPVASCSSGIFPANRSEQAVTPVCTSSGGDASTDMLYGDINLANRRANGESS